MRTPQPPWVRCTNVLADGSVCNVIEAPGFYCSSCLVKRSEGKWVPAFLTAPGKGRLNFTVNEAAHQRGEHDAEALPGCASCDALMVGS